MASLKVLVVDDSVTMRRILINILRMVGFDRVVEAEDGVDAWAKLQSEGDIGLILTDWNMPNMGGLEFVKKVRSDPRFREVPIIMVTVRGVKEDVIEAMKAGVNNYIVKPFTPQVLREKIEKVLSPV
ncbi:MAG: two-component system response regulator [Candidatus Latescibacterota bacterium]|nr:MAG: two-component system response regulator [Candidatus Latescibacterota bacterium]RKY71435.1 MAG: two-component system response regulator [Candidatus Latescibacterota bacterium]HDI00505.1 response regulator [Bacillota bacterium]